jgi:predicted lipoprotein with Yx(FWY)xxD motif
MKVYSLAALAAVSLLTLSACGSGSSSTNAGTTGGGSSTPKPASTSSGLHVASTSIGKVVVDGNGMTVYMLTADKPDHSSCSAACLAYWPPVAPSSETGISAKVGSTSTMSGGKTATVGGWPVYTFVQDQKAGDVNGEGVKTFGGTWYAISASGKPVTSGGSKSPTSPSSSAYGRGY